MNRAFAILQIATPLVWLGMVLGISVRKTPLKFRAPDITPALRNFDRMPRIRSERPTSTYTPPNTSPATPLGHPPPGGVTPLTAETDGGARYQDH